MSTISDVANLAGVSTATVSRVLNGYTHVSPRVLERVEKAIAELGYEPNAMAKSLRTLKSNRIIVTVPDIANPFYANIIRGVEETASAAGYAVLLGDIGAALLKRKEADGLIFLGHSLPDSLHERVTREGAAAPVVNGCEFSGSLPVSSVNIDNTAAAREMIEHLHGLGHRRIGVITGDMRSPTSRGRLSGVEQAATALGIIDTLQVVQGDYTIESGIARAAELTRDVQRPTAIFCFSDDMAFGAIHALREAGLSCPGDVSVAGFDDLRLAKYAQPALTTIRQPMHEIGVKTVELLLDIIENGALERTNLTLGHELVVRASTAAPR
jgi:LacI family repressor for deo operon, udp, cdd, tsx, nupC, and nupG